MPKREVNITGTLYEAVDSIIVNSKVVVIKFKWQNKPTTERTYNLHHVKRIGADMQ